MSKAGPQYKTNGTINNKAASSLAHTNEALRSNNQDTSRRTPVKTLGRDSLPFILEVRILVLNTGKFSLDLNLLHHLDLISALVV